MPHGSLARPIHQVLAALLPITDPEKGKVVFFQQTLDPIRDNNDNELSLCPLLADFPLVVFSLQTSMRVEGKMLAGTPYGAKILEVLGRVYNLQAEMVLGGVVSGLPLPLQGLSVPCK